MRWYFSAPCHGPAYVGYFIPDLGPGELQLDRLEGHYLVLGLKLPKGPEAREES